MSRQCPPDLLEQLQSALAHGTVASRVETLRRITELFIDGVVDYTDEQIVVFDDVFQCLVRNIETEAKAMLARRLAPVAKAPPRVIEQLAFDDLIEVAAPLLSTSPRLDDATLICNARIKSQGHLLAISRRSTLSEAVTDALIEFGNDEVVRSAVDNPGAQFSEAGYAALVSHGQHDDDLATCLGLRTSLPRHHYLKLIAKASAVVRERLETAYPQATVEVPIAVREATRRARCSTPALSHETRIAYGLVRSLYEDGRLDDGLVTSFANEHKFDETTAAIACLANVPIDLAETIMVEARTEGVLILAKVSGLLWPTAKAVVTMRDAIAGTISTDLEASRGTYERLRVATAQQVLRFHRMQHTTALGSPGELPAHHVIRAPT